MVPFDGCVDLYGESRLQDKAQAINAPVKKEAIQQRVAAQRHPTCVSKVGSADNARRGSYACVSSPPDPRWRRRWKPSAFHLHLPLLFLILMPGLVRAQGTNLVQNGDFSQGMTGWSTHRVAGSPGFSIFTGKFCLPEQSGNPYVALNTYWGGDGYIEQQIVLPEGQLTLTFRTWGHLDPVSASVRVVDEGGTEHVLGTFTPPPTEWSENPYDTSEPLQCTGNTDVTKTFDLSAYAGQTVLLRFRSTSGGTNGTFADFDDIEILSTAALSAALNAVPSTAEVGDVIRVDMTVENESGDDLSDVKPSAPLETSGMASLTLKSGPGPATADVLEAGQKEIFVYTYDVDAPGCVEFSGKAEGTNDSDATVTSDTATSNTVRIEPIVRVTKITCAEPDDDQIVPADKLELEVYLEKLCDIDIQPLRLEITPGGLLHTSSEEIVPDNVPAGTGEFVVTVDAHVANENNAQIESDLLDAEDGEKPISLEDQIVVFLRWLEDGTEVSNSQLLSLTKEDETVWDITYPNFAALTGEPPTSTDSPSMESEYYRIGPYALSRHGGGAYLKNKLVRKWALKAARYGVTDDYMPDKPAEAMDNLAQFLGDKIPFAWTTGLQLSFAEELAEDFENNQTVEKHACIGKALALGAFARTLGFRVRETDNAMLFHKLYGPVWAQHAADQVWYDGQWQWYDITFVFGNGGKIVRDYPNFYFTQRFGVFPYVRIRTWFGYQPAVPVGNAFELFGQEHGQETSVGELSSEEYWQFYADHAKGEGSTAGDGQVHIQAQSPCTMLYVDAQGRRVGAVGAITAADYPDLDSTLPHQGGGAVCEIPGAMYVPPETPIMMNGSDPNAVQRMYEEIVLPPEEMTDRFALTVTGTGDGPYKVVMWTEEGDEARELYTYSGVTSPAAAVQLDLGIDRSQPALTVVDAADLPPTPSGRAGACGAASPLALAFLLLAMIGLRVRAGGSLSRKHATSSRERSNPRQ